MKIEIFKGKDKQWYARIVAANGETIFHSEGIKQKRNCIKTAKLINLPIFFV